MRSNAPERTTLTIETRKCTATVLQPGRYEMVRDGQTVSENSRKRLQTGTITGRNNTVRNGPRATLDQVVKVQILLRQSKKYLQIAVKWAGARRLIRVFVLQPGCYGTERNGTALTSEEA